MSIKFDSAASTITLCTDNSTYQMRIGEAGNLLHLYYGRKTDETDFSYHFLPHDCGFSPNCYEQRYNRGISIDVLPQEYSGQDTGDYRVSALEVTLGNGAYGTDLRYVSHSILPGKYVVAGMPSAFAAEEEAETLVITLADELSRLQVELLYGVFAKKDVITRAVRVTNGGELPVTLQKAASLCLDLPFGSWDWIHFYGRHCMERLPERRHLQHGVQSIGSRRGYSSHHHNPFIILCDQDARETHGDCYGMMLVYSGNHKAEVEVDQTGTARVVMGIHDEQFNWILRPGETFHTPEVLLSFTHAGLGQLSRQYHRFLRDNIMRSKWKYKRRPVLINNWEATYFDFNSDKILDIARQAAELGVEMMVLDDGWFGARNGEHAGLGDWFVNERKLPGGLNPLIEQINAMGMKFGIWVEPEMVNEDSDLYRAHPDWALTVPGRKPAMSRDQLVLDYANPAVVDYIYERMAWLLGSHHIAYVKWDANRNLTNVFSRALPAEQQGEVLHRYMLGFYDLLERLTAKFPDVLFEGCSGGGGRFDAGVMAYFPQTWCSDNSDAIERLSIQYGTSFGYPISAVGAHVSACPNHQTGHSVPLDTRALVAMSGTFGYEMDLNTLSGVEKEAVKEQIKRFDSHYELIQNGDYYRLSDPQKDDYTAWAFAAPDGSELLVNVVFTHTRSNSKGIHLRLPGLDSTGLYRLQHTYCDEKNLAVLSLHGTATRDPAGRLFSGSGLMYGGYTIPMLYGDYPCIQLHFVRQ